MNLEAPRRGPREVPDSRFESIKVTSSVGGADMISSSSSYAADPVHDVVRVLNEYERCVVFSVGRFTA